MTKKLKIDFEARKGAFINGEKVQQYGECLWKLSEKGLLKPKAVVDEARPESSPLHDAFEWNDTVAAEAHRRWQARNLIRSIEFKIETLKKPKLAFFNVETRSKDDKKAQGYANYRQIFESADLRQQIIAKAKGELISWRERYEDYKTDFSEVFQAIDSLEFEE